LVAVVVLVLGGLLAGLTTWLGSVSQHTGVPLATLLEAGINVVPPALCLFGIGLLAFGLRPRWTAGAVYTVLGWSLLVELVGGFGRSQRWLLDTSLFHQMAAAPAVRPDWAVGAVMVAVGLASALLGTAAFARRDLQGA
jgi:ABC-2 type transport system permease protein